MFENNVYHMHIGLGITNKNIKEFKHPEIVFQDETSDIFPIQHVPFIYSKEQFEKIKSDTLSFVNKFFDEIEKDASF